MTSVVSDSYELTTPKAAPRGDVESGEIDISVKGKALSVSTGVTL